MSWIRKWNLPVSPLLGNSLWNFNRILEGKFIDPKYRFKVFLTRVIILLLSPLRWYEKTREMPVFNDHFTKESKLIFILGHWRSGTTYLHNILCQDPSMGFVSTYQTVLTNYMHSELLLKPIMRIIMPKYRPGDKLLLAPDLPQEEEFAISNLTDKSFYNFFYFPKYVGEYYHKYVRFHISDKDLNEFKTCYKKILIKAFQSQQNALCLVIKNPVNTARLSFLHSNFPEASFLHIYRNPYLVYISTKKFFSDIFPSLWLFPIETYEIRDLIIDLYLNIYDDYFNYLESNKDLKVIDIRYENFIEDPLPYLQSIYDNYMPKNFDSVRGRIISYIENQKSHKKDDYVISRDEYELISHKWAKNIGRWNYSLPPEVQVI